MAKFAYLFYSLRNAGVGTVAARSSRLSFFRMGTQRVAAESALYPTNGCPRGEYPDSCCSVFRFRYDSIQEVYAFFSLLCRYTPGTFSRCLAASKRRWLLPVLDDPCLFYLGWCRV